VDPLGVHHNLFCFRSDLQLGFETGGLARSDVYSTAERREANIRNRDLITVGRQVGDREIALQRSTIADAPPG
jgi:hypothetical protein